MKKMRGGALSNDQEEELGDVEEDLEDLQEEDDDDLEGMTDSKEEE